MAREREIREFTRSFFRGRPDLSTTTHSIVRQKYLAHVGRDHLEPEEKQVLKRLVEEELLQMLADDSTMKDEKLDLTKKLKRSPNSCRDPAKPSSAASSPGCLASPAKEEENPTGASKKVVESSDEEPQRDLMAKRGSESNEEYSEGRTRKKPGTKKKQATGKPSAKKQAREDSEDSEEEPVQRKAKKAGGHREAKSHQGSEGESEAEEILAKKKKNSEEEEEEEDVCKSRATTNGERSAWKGRNCKQKSRAGTLVRDLGDSEEEEKEAANSGDNPDPPVQTKSVDRTACKDRIHSGSSEDEDSDAELATVPSTTKTTKSGSVNGEDSDTEKEVSDGEVGTSPKEERKSRSSKKNSKKGRTRSSSSSSDGSPETKGGKAGSGRRGEDHPAVTRLKRYIRACGAHRNYKKLLGSCRSHKERLNVLRAELEALGMKGNPSLEKCRALKEKREEEAEVASLDMANIISGSGRPRRRTAWNPSGEPTPQGELYCRTLDSEEDGPRQAPPDWSHMRGIISSDGESS
ncbi:HIRA-interacting protein 3 isoform 2-T2 [Thomomys bottae]